VTPAPPRRFDDDWVKTMYARKVDSFGSGHHAQGWASRASQRKRFAALAEVAADLRGASVLDAGCGLGDLYAYFEERGVAADIRYTGLDFTPRMVVRARERFPHLTFVPGDASSEKTDLPPADYVLASGLFSHMTGDEDRVRATIGRLWNAARRALAFNVLSTLTDPGSDEARAASGLFAADPLETLRFSRTLTPWVALRHDYLPHDFTIYLYREPRTA
jgi:SAM-dependent methyltransferase